MSTNWTSLVYLGGGVQEEIEQVEVCNPATAIATLPDDVSVVDGSDGVAVEEMMDSISVVAGNGVAVSEDDNSVDVQGEC